MLDHNDHEYEHNPALYDKIVVGLQEYVKFITDKYPDGEKS